MLNKKYHLKMKSYCSNNKMCFIFFLLLIFIPFTSQNYVFIAESKFLENDLEPLNINYTINNCSLVIPSLFSPIILAYNDYDFENGHFRDLAKIKFETPLSSFNEIVEMCYKEKDLDLYYSIHNQNIFEKSCYFGLSMLLLNASGKEIYTEINNFIVLKDKKEINETIFSFNKWEILNNLIKTELHLGYSHPDFSSKDGIIGTCINAEENSSWSCVFNNITFQNKTISLKKEDNEYYKIYFSSESHEIIFPQNFREIFDNATEGNCSVQSITILDKVKRTYACTNYFVKDNNISLTLNNDNMSITLEVDNYQRFSQEKSEIQKNHSRIIFPTESNDIIFPLIMFKQFHVQFNGEKNVINFFTKDENLLKVKKEPKNDSSDSGSSGSTVVLVILLIILFLALCFGIFYFVKKKLNKSVENDINKFNKFEDEEENGKVLDDKKVY